MNPGHLNHKFYTFMRILEERRYRSLAVLIHYQDIFRTRSRAHKMWRDDNTIWYVTAFLDRYLMIVSRRPFFILFLPRPCYLFFFIVNSSNLISSCNHSGVKVSLLCGCRTFWSPPFPSNYRSSFVDCRK